MPELDGLERALLEASSVWFDQHLHLKLQRLIAIARAGEAALRAQRASAAAKTPPGFKMPPSESVDRPVAPRLSSSGGTAAVVSPARFAEPADMHGNGE